MTKGKVLVAPLNWGLGHSARCIPIINELIKQHYNVIIASDGIALELLKKEFPTLTAYNLPELNITYPKNGFWFNFKIFTQLSKFQSIINKEQKLLNEIIAKENITGIISDNRLGLFHQNIPCVIISHQLNVLSGNTTWLTSKIHLKYLKKFNDCWVPDNKEDPNLSGRLGHLKTEGLNTKYLGIISRFEKKNHEILYDILIVLSGPEPQRSYLEDILIKELKAFPKKVVLVKGVVEDTQKTYEIGNITVYNFMKSKQLELFILQSQVIVARSGYTTLMDLAKLDKKAFFIPTPGQSEQEYLADRLEGHRIAPFCEQKDFDSHQIKRIAAFKGLGSIYRANTVDFADIFSLFDGK